MKKVILSIAVAAFVAAVSSCNSCCSCNNEVVCEECNCEQCDSTCTCNCDSCSAARQAAEAAQPVETPAE